jgi:hypothetical protein
MRNSIRNNVVVERKQWENGDEREAAITGSSRPGSRATGTAEFLAPHRRVVKAETPTLRDGAMRRSAMGRPSNDIGKQISRELRGLYDDVVSQPVPDRFLDLLDRLETTAIPSSAGSKAPGKR